MVDVETLKALLNFIDSQRPNEIMDDYNEGYHDALDDIEHFIYNFENRENN